MVFILIDFNGKLPNSHNESASVWNSALMIASVNVSCRCDRLLFLSMLGAHDNSHIAFGHFIYEFEARRTESDFFMRKRKKKSKVKWINFNHKRRIFKGNYFVKQKPPIIHLIVLRTNESDFISITSN